MRQEIIVHDAARVTVCEYKYRELDGKPANGYTVMVIHVSCTDGSEIDLTLFGGKGGIVFSAPALENRPCAACGNLMPRDYHPRVTVCAACETEGAALAHTGG